MGTNVSRFTMPLAERSEIDANGRYLQTDTNNSLYLQKFNLKSVLDGGDDAGKFCEALHHHGFALLDVEETLAAAPSNLIDAAGEFFAMDQEAKDATGGFQNFKGRVAGYKNSQLQDSEFLELHLTHKDGCCPELPAPLNFQEVMVPCYRAMSLLARQLLVRMANHIEADPGVFLDSLDPDEPAEMGDDTITSSCLRVCSYHCEDKEEGPRGGKEARRGVLFDEHTDSTFVTVAPISRVPGLEFELPETGEWLELEADPCVSQANFCVFVGDFAQLFSRNYYKAAKHRVTRPKIPCHRVSMPLLVRGRPEHIIETEKYSNDGQHPHVFALSETSMKMLRQMLDKRGNRQMHADKKKKQEEKAEKERKARGAAHRAMIIAERAAKKAEAEAEKAAAEQAARRSSVPVSTHICESAVVSASIEEVWSVFRNLDFGFSDQICGGELIHGDCSTQIGSVHKLHFKDGTEWEIQLMSLSDQKRILGFQMLSRTDGVNVSSCQHRVSLKAVTSTSSTFVEWTVDFSNDADATVILDSQFKRRSDLTALQTYFQ